MEKEFEASFEEAYEKVKMTCTDTLKEVKKENNKFLQKVLIVLIILNIIVAVVPEIRFVISLSICLSICVLIFLYSTGNKNYGKIYKETVIEQLIKSYNERFYYDPQMGIAKIDYSLAQFDEKYDIYESEDRIFGRFDKGDNFQLSEVAILELKKSKDSKGRTVTTKKQVFRGMYGIVRLERNTLSTIHITSTNPKNRFIKHRVEVDSSEFEQYYDCLTRDRIDAMRIFTPDLIEKYVDLVRDNKYGIELKIRDDMLFFRYKTNQVFEPPMYKSGLEKDFLKKNYRIIFYPLNIMKSTVDAVHEIY